MWQDRGLLGPILLTSATTATTTNLTHASWKICTGLHGEALKLFSPTAPEPPGGWRRGGAAPLAGTGTWVRLHLAVPTLPVAPPPPHGGTPIGQADETAYLQNIVLSER